MACTWLYLAGHRSGGHTPNRALWRGSILAPEQYTAANVQDHQPLQLDRPHPLDEDHHVSEADEELEVGYGALRHPLPFGD